MLQVHSCTQRQRHSRMPGVMTASPVDAADGGRLCSQHCAAGGRFPRPPQIRVRRRIPLPSAVMPACDRCLHLVTDPNVLQPSQMWSRSARLVSVRLRAFSGRLMTRQHHGAPPVVWAVVPPVRTVRAAAAAAVAAAFGAPRAAAAPIAAAAAVSVPVPRILTAGHRWMRQQPNPDEKLTL